jgi:hypothetical protein
MLTCEECGGLVDPEATDIHLNWHKDLVKKDELSHSAKANPNRTRVLNKIINEG